MAIAHCYCHLVVKNGNFTLLLSSSCQEWQFHIAADIATEMVNHEASYLPDVILTILLFKHILAGPVCRCSVHLNQIYPLPKYVRRIEQDQMWDEVHQISSQNTPHNLSDEVTKIRCEMKYPAWQFQIYPPSPNIEFSGLAISHCYWHLVVMNANFTLLLTSSRSRMAIAHC